MRNFAAELRALVQNAIYLRDCIADGGRLLLANVMSIICGKSSICMVERPPIAGDVVSDVSLRNAYSGRVRRRLTEYGESWSRRRARGGR